MSFDQHVDYLRLPPKQPSPPKAGSRPHPKPIDFKRKKPVSTVESAGPQDTAAHAGVNSDLVEINDKDGVDQEVDEVI